LQKKENVSDQPKGQPNEHLESADNPMQHPEEQPSGGSDGPHFGKLLIVLILAVAIIGIVTIVSEAYLS
jgi:hypothetical protein